MDPTNVILVWISTSLTLLILSLVVVRGHVFPPLLLCVTSRRFYTYLKVSKSETCLHRITGNECKCFITRGE